MAERFSTLKVGIAGAGLMGRWHAKFARRLGAKIVAVTDRDLSRAKKLSASLGGHPAEFADSQEMLLQTRPDILHVCTPPESHYPVAMQAIERGVNPLIEKPLTPTASETRALLRAARDHRVVICPVHQLAFQQGVQEASRALESLGELLEMRFTACSAGGAGQSNDGLNRIVMDMLPHPLSVMRKVRPGVSLDTSEWRGMRSRDGELQLSGNADGVAVSILISMNARPTRLEMEMFCSKGRVFLNFFHGYAVIEKGRVSRVQKLAQPFKYAVKEFFLAGSNAARRGLRGEYAYPGLIRLLECFYRSVVEQVPSPIAERDVIDIATARDDLIRRFAADRTTPDPE